MMQFLNTHNVFHTSEEDAMKPIISGHSHLNQYNRLNALTV